MKYRPTVNTRLTHVWRTYTWHMSDVFLYQIAKVGTVELYQSYNIIIHLVFELGDL